MGLDRQAGYFVLGAATETILDWRPFEYFTVEITPQPGSVTLLLSYRLEPLDDGRGTRLLHTHTFFKRPLPRWLARPVCRFAAGRVLRSDLALLAQLIEAEAGEAEGLGTAEGENLATNYTNYTNLNSGRTQTPRISEILGVFVCSEAVWGFGRQRGG